jgi:hypothetical protein
MEPLKNTLEFVKNAPVIAASDAKAAANVVHNVIEGLSESQ